jgi:SRSO17 transposase
MGVNPIVLTPGGRSRTDQARSDAFAELQERIAGRFARVEVRERVRRYLVGVLGRVDRKNGWQLAETIGEASPRGVQRLLNGATWDADGVRDDLRASVVDHLGDAASGVLILDDTGFIKKGERSCGVARQYTGTVGDTANAQVGVFLAYASARGAAFIDRAFYLPHAWTDDAERRRKAGVPTTVQFATKIRLAQDMLARAGAASVPASWVLADAGYGRSHRFRRWLEDHEWAYALMVPKTHAVWYRGRRQTVAKLAGRLTEEDWTQPPSGAGPYNVQRQEWACLPLSEACRAGMQRWLLVRRSVDEPDELAYYLVYGPDGTPTTDLVRRCGHRWQIEECFAQAKGEVGLDQYEVRTWTAWYRFVTLCLVAHAYLVVMRHAARVESEEDGQKGDLRLA